MHSALLISHAEKGLEEIIALLRKLSVGKIDIAKTCGEGRRKAMNCPYDLYIIDTPVYTESGEGLALELVASDTSQVIMMVQNDQFARLCHKVEDAGVLTVPKPMNKTLIYLTLKLAKASWARLQAVQKQKVTLNQKMQDMKIVARAKCILISQFKMTEIEAHKYIEKEAMNARKGKREIAERILRTYE